MAPAVVSTGAPWVQPARSRSIPPARATQALAADPAFAGEWGWSAVKSLDSMGPAGLGKSMRRRVEDVMQPGLAVTSPQSPLREAAASLQASDCLPVVDGHFRLVGLLSERDARKQGATVEEVMRPALAVEEADSLASAAALMLEKGLSCLPVVDSDGRVVGAVTKSALFWCLAEYADAVRPQ